MKHAYETRPVFPSVNKMHVFFLSFKGKKNSNPLVWFHFLFIFFFPLPSFFPPLVVPKVKNGISIVTSFVGRVCFRYV